MLISGKLVASEGDTATLLLDKPYYDVFSGKVEEIMIRGKNIPSDRLMRYRFEGAFDADSAFSVVGFERFAPETAEEEVYVLMDRFHLQKKTASSIVFCFGLGSEDMLLKDPDFVFSKIDARSREIRIAKKGLYEAMNPELYSYMKEFEVSGNAVFKLVERFGKTAMHVVKADPYSLPYSIGISFELADNIALANNVASNSVTRICAGITAALTAYKDGDNLIRDYSRKCKKQMVTGSTFVREDDLVPFVRHILGENISENNVKEVLGSKSCRTCDNDPSSIFAEEGKMYALRSVARQELNAAKDIKRIMSNRTLDVDLSVEQIQSMKNELIEKGGLAGALSEEQANAVRTALGNPVSIITGGPGTGKTTIQTAILYLAEKNIPGLRIKMIAPTGRAASRMSESSGRPACTIHSALGLGSGEEDGDLKQIDADMIVVDEFSMVDAFLAEKLFASVKSGSKILCIGDINQLPSVGAGSVLRELIESEVLPTALLTGVFRQKKGSSIADNAYKINDGKSDLVYDESFQFVEMQTDDIAKKICDLFQEEVGRVGIENVCILTPFREKTDTGTNEINQAIQKRMVPDGTNSCMVYDTRFCEGDRVMYRKNKNGLSNGDVGTIRRITEDDMEIEFDGRGKVKVPEEDFQNLTLAYAVTIHKSQGSEYKTVIMAIDERHSIMAKRNLIYTGVTRAKGKLIAVGSKKALAEGVKITETNLRESMLANFLRTEFA